MSDHGHGHSHGDGSGDHQSTVVALGTIQIDDTLFTIDREGQFTVTGKATVFGVEKLNGSLVPTSAWIMTSKGEKVSEPATGDGHNDHWHFTLTPKAGIAAPADPDASLLFVLEAGGVTKAVSIHETVEPSHGGIVAPLHKSGSNDDGASSSAYLELKLHDDKGDLELFVSQDMGRTPISLSPLSVVTITFPSHGNRSVSLAVRNMVDNEDEDGNKTMVSKGTVLTTSYFIFPGETPQDPVWLQGEKWRGHVTVRVETPEGDVYTSDAFVLVPHSLL